MSMYGFTSVFEVIEKYVSDCDVNLDVSHWEGRIIRFIMEAEAFIGSAESYIHKECILCVKDYRVELPCDFYNLKRIDYNGKALLHNGTGHIDFSDDYFKLFPKVEVQGYVSQSTIDGFQPIQHRIRSCTEEAFSIHNDIVHTTFKEGEIYLSYLAIPMDSKGFPMVRDTIEHLDALVKYIEYKMFYIEFKNDRIPLQKYDYVKREWYRAARNAKGSDQMPKNGHEREYIRNVMNRLVVKSGGFSNNYRNIDKDGLHTRRY